MDNFIEENRKANEHLGNVQFVCSDAMSLDFPAGSFDIVFSNWLLMYLNDEEVCAPNIWPEHAGALAVTKSCRLIGRCLSLHYYAPRMHDGGRAEQRCASRYRQVATLAARIMDWLAPGGHVFFRESCFHQSGNKPRDSNPSHYRNPEQYEAIFAVCVRPSDI
jgi:phosphoethanolamine N-methyltransferase